jgi:hypothetical protein
LVFDLPGLTKYGDKCRIFNNNVHDNNRINFAAEGNIVSSVPIGTGTMVLSTKNVEISNNTLSNNNFANVLVVNYLTINANPGDPNYDPFPSGIFIHDNAYTMEGMVNFDDQNDLNKQIIGLLQLTGLGQADILADGLLTDATSVCIQEGTASFVNLNVGDQTFMSVTNDRSAHDCTKEALPAVTFDPF